LFDLLPVDEPKLNRRDISAKGVGILLYDIAAVQKKVGTCKCKARKDNLRKFVEAL
jgi:hypothetical protein